MAPSSVETIQDLQRRLIKKAFVDLTTVVLPLLFLIFLRSSSTFQWEELRYFSRAFFKGDVTENQLVIIEGQKKVKAPSRYSLQNSSKHEILLETPNLIGLNVHRNKNLPSPYIILKKPNSQDVFQTFQLLEEDEEGSPSFLKYYSIKFSLTESMDLYISDLSSPQGLAYIQVETPSLPTVRLKSLTKIKDPMHDNVPLDINLEASGKNHLNKLSLVIRSGSQEYTELVNDLSGANLQEFKTDHVLFLEKYVNQDIVTLEILARITDKALPRSLVGYSAPLTINVASAYGRYKQTLTTIKNLKEILDHSVSQQQTSLPEEARELSQKSLQQAADSPFFDSLDRVEIRSFHQRVEQNLKSFSFTEVFSLSTDINNFLAGHEMLDDRERDRDFFIAARSLSRLLEKKRNSSDIPMITDNMKKFLQQRKIRWEQRLSRVERNPELEKKWQEIKNQRPFEKTMDQIKENHRVSSSQKAQESLDLLSKAVPRYKNWIGLLEKAEDQQKQKWEKEKRKALASAQEELRDLQKRQGEVSTKLDKAEERSVSELENQWPVARMKENMIAKDTKKLEAKIREFTPRGSLRLKFAHEAMKETLSHGNQKKFQQAESFSDQAGRLLRQALRETKRSSRSSSSRRRRRVSGDQYYGQSIHGGDIKIIHDYKIDRRYREDILEQVGRESKDLEGEDRKTLNDYLRKVIR